MATVGVQRVNVAVMVTGYTDSRLICCCTLVSWGS